MGRHWIVALPARDDEVVAGSGGADDGAMVVFGEKSRRVALQLLFFRHSGLPESSVFVFSV